MDIWHEERLLIDGAKREGELTLYSSMQVDSITPLQKAFEAKYGVRVRIWRGSGNGARISDSATEDHKSWSFL